MVARGSNVVCALALGSRRRADGVSVVPVATRPRPKLAPAFSVPVVGISQRERCCLYFILLALGMLVSLHSASARELALGGAGPRERLSLDQGRFSSQFLLHESAGAERAVRLTRKGEKSVPQAKTHKSSRARADAAPAPLTLIR